jgi:hypothetical protein
MIVGIRFLTLLSSIRILRAGNKGKGIVVCNYARAGKHFLCGGQGRGGREEETKTGEDEEFKRWRAEGVQKLVRDLYDE